MSNVPYNGADNKKHPFHLLKDQKPLKKKNHQKKILKPVGLLQCQDTEEGMITGVLRSFL